MLRHIRRLLRRETPAERRERLLERDYWRRIALDAQYREGRITLEVYWDRTRALDDAFIAALERGWTPGG